MLYLFPSRFPAGQIVRLSDRAGFLKWLLCGA